MIDNLIRMTLLVGAAAFTTFSVGKALREKANKGKDCDKHFRRQTDEPVSPSEATKSRVSNES